MRQLTRLLSVLLLLALAGCAGGAATLPVLDAAGQAAVMGVGAGYFLPRLLGIGQAPAPPAAPAGLALPVGVTGVLILPGTKADVTIKAVP